MPRPRQPTNVHKLRGSDKVNPGRLLNRANEPDPVGEIGPPPDRLAPDEAAAWLELVAMAHAGTLCAADRGFMEYAAKVWLEIKESHAVDPKVGIRFEAIIAKLGMSPADRSRVSVVKQKSSVDPYAEFADAG